MKLSITITSILLFTTSIIISIGCAAWYWYQTMNVIPRSQHHLHTAIQKRVTAIEKYLLKKEENLRALAHEEKIISFLQAPQESTSLRLFMQSYETSHHIINTLLIKPDGTIVFASKDHKALHVTITDHAYRHTSLAQSFDRTLKTMTPDIASFSFDMLLKKPTLYATMPVFTPQKLLIGVIAIQLNIQEIYEITHNYFDLGKTGNVLLAKAVKSGAQLIAPTRDNPENTFSIIEFQEKKSLLPLEHALSGHEGSGVTIDYKNRKVVAAWAYIPLLAWGIALTRGYEEVTRPIYIAYQAWRFSLLLMFVILLSIMCIQYASLLSWTKKHIVKDPVNLFLVIVIIITAISSFYLIIRYRTRYRTAIDQSLNTAEQKIAFATQQLEKELSNIAQRAQAIADDLSSNRLRKEDIIIRIHRDIKENPYLSGLTIAFGSYQFDPQHRLYAPHIIRFNDTFKQEQLETITDYTKNEIINGVSTASWYQTALKGATWLAPIKEQITKKLVARYAAPFYSDQNKTKAIGVVVAEFALDSLATLMQKITIGKTGYSFIIDSAGTFIYHPTHSLVTDQVTLFTYAQQQINKPLYDSGTTIITKTKGQHSFIDPHTSLTTWITYTPINHSPWTIALAFTEEEITVPTVFARHSFMGIISAILMSILLIVFLFCRTLITPKRRLHIFALSSGLILLAGLGVLWYFIRATTYGTAHAPDQAIVENQTTLTAYVEERRQEAHTQYQNIVTIPTGIFITSIVFDSIKSVSLSGYIWQKYPRSQTLQRSIMIPGATKASFEKIHQSSAAAYETIGWKFTTTIPTIPYYTQYPFDIQHLNIPLAHSDQKIKVLLTPDFDGYQDYLQQKHLGISRDFSIPEFAVEETYFSYRMIEQPKPLALRMTNTNLYLHYTVLLMRNTLHAFIIYFIPLFVILFALFATISFTKVTDHITSSAIIPYTAPLFALIILHANLRSLYTVGDILYVEYLFFLTYLTILLAIGFNILIAWRKKKTTIASLSNLITLFFWPVQFILWYGATIIAFY